MPMQTETDASDSERPQHTIADRHRTLHTAHEADHPNPSWIRDGRYIHLPKSRQD